MRSTLSSWVHLLLPQISLSKPFKKALKARLSLSPSERPHLWSSAFISEVIWSKGQVFFNEFVIQKYCFWPGRNSSTFLKPHLHNCESLSPTSPTAEMTQDLAASKLGIISDDFQRRSNPLTSKFNWVFFCSDVRCRRLYQLKQSGPASPNLRPWWWNGFTLNFTGA